MKIKEEETPQEKQERLSTIDNYQNELIKKALPILTVILLVMIVTLIVINKKAEDKPIGNPYECSDCKELGRACKDHKEYNPNEDLKKKIQNCIYNLKYLDEGEEIYTYYLYGESYYNLDCDFCNSNKAECPGCEYTRKSIIEYTNRELTEDTIDRMCTECKKLGYPYCSSDITFVTERVYDSIKR